MEEPTVVWQSVVRFAEAIEEQLVLRQGTLLAEGVMVGYQS